MRPRILVVEEDVALGEALSDFIVSLGYEAFLATTAPVAQRVVAGAPRPAAVLLDSSVVGEGRRLFEELRQQGVKVVVMTAPTDELAADAVDGILRKPFDLTALTRAVRHVCPLLKRQEPPSPSASVEGLAHASDVVAVTH